MSLSDPYGRKIDYMRISITDRCNLRCFYCMPEEVESVPMEDILTYEEILRVCRIGADLGISHLKITGGEPLVRKGCTGLIAELKKIPGIETVTLTTNGVLLKEHLPELLEAGTDGINISLDTLCPESFQKITGRDYFHKVTESLRAAAESGILVKVNSVSIEDILNDSWKELMLIAKELPVDVRFIEMMPIGYGALYKPLSHEKLLAEMKKMYPALEKDEKKHGYGPAVYYKIPGWQGSIGLISAIHGKFCQGCNRIRMTSQGHLKACLCFEDGTDLRELLRNGSSDEDIKAAMVKVVMEKPGAHCFEEKENITEIHGMSKIGG